MLRFFKKILLYLSWDEISLEGKKYGNELYVEYLCCSVPSQKGCQENMKKISIKCPNCKYGYPHYENSKVY